MQNATVVCSLLEKSGRRLAVFQGHSHKNDSQQIAGIHAPLIAMLEVMRDSSLRLQGFGR